MSSAGRATDPGAPKASSRASARSSSSVATAASNAAIRFAGPRAAAPANTTKSQYGQTDTQNGTWTYSPTGGRARTSVIAATCSRNATAELTDPATPAPEVR